jgi:hypothetical protein
VSADYTTSDERAARAAALLSQLCAALAAAPGEAGAALVGSAAAVAAGGLHRRVNDIDLSIVAAAAAPVLRALRDRALELRLPAPRVLTVSPPWFDAPRFPGSFFGAHIDVLIFSAQPPAPSQQGGSASSMDVDNADGSMTDAAIDTAVQQLTTPPPPRAGGSAAAPPAASAAAGSSLATMPSAAAAAAPPLPALAVTVQLLLRSSSSVRPTVSAFYSTALDAFYVHDAATAGLLLHVSNACRRARRLRVAALPPEFLAGRLLPGLYAIAAKSSDPGAKSHRALAAAAAACLAWLQDETRAYAAARSAGRELPAWFAHGKAATLADKARKLDEMATGAASGALSRLAAPLGQRPAAAATKAAAAAAKMAAAAGAQNAAALQSATKESERAASTLAAATQRQSRLIGVLRLLWDTRYRLVRDALPIAASASARALCGMLRAVARPQRGGTAAEADARHAAWDAMWSCGGAAARGYSVNFAAELSRLAGPSGGFRLPLEPPAVAARAAARQAPPPLPLPLPPPLLMLQLQQLLPPPAAIAPLVAALLPALDAQAAPLLPWGWPCCTLLAGSGCGAADVSGRPCLVASAAASAAWPAAHALRGHPSPRHQAPERHGLLGGRTARRAHDALQAHRFRARSNYGKLQ